MMTRLALIFALVAGAALAQQPAPQINPDILTMQRNAALDDNARLMTMLTTERAAAEAQKATLIEWLKAAQGDPKK